MSKIKRTIAKRRRINNIAYHASRDQLSHEFRQAVKALPVIIQTAKRTITKPTMLQLVKAFLAWDLKLVKCVVPISGGKDSQTCLALAVKHFRPCNVIALFCDVKWEHPWTYEHVANLGGALRSGYYHSQRRKRT